MSALFVFTTPMTERKPIVWITGGTSGIGLATAVAFAEKEYRIAVSGRNEAKLNAAVSMLEELDAEVIGTITDVSKSEDIATAMDEITKSFGSSPDILINNAGIAPWGTFTETTIEEFDAAMNINVLGYFLAAKAVIPGMIAKGGGDIVQRLSISSRKAFKNGAAYNTSKFAELGMTDSMREDLRGKNIRVISIMPGATETEMWDEPEREKYREKMMQPEDIAKAVMFTLELPRRAAVEAIVIRPIGGDL
jgi:3-oxoacyl-[acyl-carrier protein] reductase